MLKPSRTTAIVSLATTFAILAATPAQARMTGWITGLEWMRVAKTLTPRNEMPVSVTCKDSDNKGLNFKSGLANVRIEKNTRGILWHWAFGSHVAKVKSRLERQGYKLVSYSEYRRSSGLKVPCAIWHKR